MVELASLSVGGTGDVAAFAPFLRSSAVIENPNSSAIPNIE
jgi:hypothetical protein